MCMLSKYKLAIIHAKWFLRVGLIVTSVDCSNEMLRVWWNFLEDNDYTQAFIGDFVE